MKTKTSKSATRSELADRYGVSMETLKKWIEKIPDLSLSPTDRVLTPKQVATIIAHLGEP